MGSQFEDSHQDDKAPLLMTVTCSAECREVIRKLIVILYKAGVIKEDEGLDFCFRKIRMSQLGKIPRYGMGIHKDRVHTKRKADGEDLY